LKQQERICCNCLAIMRVFWIFFATLAFTTGKVIKLQGTVEEEDMRCSFSMVVKKMKVNVQRSKVTCTNPSRKILVADYTIGNEEVEFTLSFKVAKSGKGKIQKASIEIKDTPTLQMDEEGLPNYISPMGLPSDWGNGSEVKDVRGNTSTPAKRTYYGYVCNTNGWDAEQWCLCKPGQKVSSMKSWHDNGREDRRWEMKCEDIKPEFKVTSSRWFHTTSANAWDGHVKWEGWWDDSFLVGMTSVHDNHREDRQFKFMTTRSDLWDVTNSCWGWRKINHYDHELNLNTHGDEVIVGLQSWHSNHREDREWWAVVCKLKSKCNTGGVLKTDISRARFSNEKALHVHFDTVDASKSKTDVAVSKSFTRSQKKSLSGTKTVTRTHGHKFNVGFEITKNFGVQIKAVNVGGSYTFSAGYEYSYSTQLTRSETTEFVEGEDGRTTFDFVCAAGYICKSSVKISKVTATVPYTLTAGACKEEGVITLDNSFTGELEKIDTYVGEKPPTTCEDDGRYKQYCPGWAKWACVGQYESFMRRYCPKSCKFCV